MLNINALIGVEGSSILEMKEEIQKRVGEKIGVLLTMSVSGAASTLFLYDRETEDDLAVLYVEQENGKHVVKKEKKLAADVENLLRLHEENIKSCSGTQMSLPLE